MHAHPLLHAFSHCSCAFAHATLSAQALLLCPCALHRVSAGTALARLRTPPCQRKKRGGQCPDWCAHPLHEFGVLVTNAVPPIHRSHGRSWENVWGIWNGFVPADGEALRRTATILRFLGALGHLQAQWLPHFPVEKVQSCAHCCTGWPAEWATRAPKMHWGGARGAYSILVHACGVVRRPEPASLQASLPQRWTRTGKLSSFCAQMPQAPFLHGCARSDRLLAGGLLLC